MAFYGDERELVHKFAYKKVLVEIYKGIRGATCCDLDHEHEKTKCDSCGKKIEPQPVYFVSILGTEIMEQPTKDDAIEWAKNFLDDRIDRLQADLYESLMDPDDDEAGEEQEEGEDPPVPAAVGKQDLTPLEKQIVKLGWVQKANAILNSIQPQA